MKLQHENHDQTQSTKLSDGLESSKAAGVPVHCSLSLYLYLWGLSVFLRVS